MVYKVFGAALLLQILFLFGVRLVVAQHGGSIRHLVQVQDASEYIRLAGVMLTEGKFSFPTSSYPDGKQFPETFRTPGYPLFVAGVFALFGNSVGTLENPGVSFYALLVSLCMLGAGAAVVVFLILRELGIPTPWSVAGGVLFSLSPAVMFLPPSGMGSDMLFTFLFALVLYLLLKLESAQRSWLTALYIGLLLGFATLSRPAGLYLSIVVILALPFFLPRAKPYLKTIALPCAAALAGFLLILTPWYARNWSVAGHFDLSSIPIYSAAFYNIPMFLAFHNHTSHPEEEKKILASLGNPPNLHLRSFEYSAELKKMEVEFLKQYFLPYSFFHAIKMIPFFLGSGVDVSYAVINIETGNTLNVPFMPKVDENLSSLVYSGNLKEVAKNLLAFWPATLERLVWAGLFALTFLAPFLAKGRERKFFILAILLILVAAVLASPVAQPRYRVSVEPLVWVSALYCAYMIVREGILKRIWMKIRIF